MNPRSRLLGILLLGAWGWWALGWAVDLSTVSPLHWSSLLPRFVLEAVPATVGAVTAGLLVVGSPRARSLAWLCAVVTAHAVLVAAAVPDLADQRDETLREARALWPQRSPVSGAGGLAEPDPDRERLNADGTPGPTSPPRGNPDAD